MAWLNGVRTTYCGRCGNKGHNRRGCPDIPPEEKKASIGTRRCGWCREMGHDTRHCETRNTAFQEYYQKNAAYRREFFERLALKGMFPGALIVGRTPTPSGNEYYDDLPLEAVPSKYVLFAEKIEWERVLSPDVPTPARVSWRRRQRMRNRVGTRSVVLCRALGQPENDEYDYHYTPTTYAAPDASDYSWHTRYTVKVTGAPVAWESLPEDWRSGISGTDRIWSKNKK